jgi:hypothetical protein
LDGITRDVYEDPDGQQWVFGSFGRLYRLWLPEKVKQVTRPPAEVLTPPPSPASLPLRGAVWFIRSRGQESGPFTFDEVNAKVVAGTIGGEDLTRKGNAAWAPVKSYRFFEVTLPTKSEPASVDNKIYRVLPEPPGANLPLPPAPMPLPDKPLEVPKPRGRGVLPSRPPQAKAVTSTVSWTSDNVVSALFGVAVFLFILGACISGAFKIPLWLGISLGAASWGAFAAVVLLGSHLKNMRNAREAERKRLENEAWLRTPEGMAWQKEEREKQRELKEEDERRRKEAEELAARAKWRLYHESKTMDEISRMSGTEFEEFLARLFSRMGYTDIGLTPANDQGGDLLCLSPTGIRLVIQAKRWSGPVGNSAVQELLGAMLHYDRNEGMVVTNSTFTVAACELAKKDPRITLHDGRWLEEQIKKFLPAEIPEFDWDEYNREVKDWRPARAGRSRKSRFFGYKRRRW